MLSLQALKPQAFEPCISMGARKSLDCTLKLLQLQVAVFIFIGLLKIERLKVAAFNTSRSRDTFNAA